MLSTGETHATRKLIARVPPWSRKITEIDRPRFPVIDAHNHLAEPFGGGWDKKPLPELLDRLDQVNIRLYIDLDGGWGEDILNAHLDYFKTPAPNALKSSAAWIGRSGPNWATNSQSGLHSACASKKSAAQRA